MVKDASYYEHIQIASVKASQSINNQLYRMDNDYETYLKLFGATTYYPDDLEADLDYIERMEQAGPINYYRERRLRNRVLKRFNETMSKGKLTRISSIDIEFNIPTTPEDWYNWPNIIEGIFKKPPVFGCVTGVQGSGKSHFSVWLMEQLSKKGFNIASNITLGTRQVNIGMRALSHYIKVNTMSQVMKLPENTIIFLDETGIHWSKRDSTTSKNREMDKFIRLFRKKGFSLILLDQQYYTIPTLLKEWSTFRVQRYPSHKTNIYSRIFNGRVTDLPLTLFKFDTKEQPHFTIDLKIDDYLQAVDRTYFDVKQAMKPKRGRPPGTGKNSKKVSDIKEE